MPEPEAAVSAPASAPRFEPDERWVPADQRLFGWIGAPCARRWWYSPWSFVMSVVLPVINATVPYDDIVRAGDVIEIEGNVTFVPEAGWGITLGVRAGHSRYPGSIPRLRPSRTGH